VWLITELQSVNLGSGATADFPLTNERYAKCPQLSRCVALAHGLWAGRFGSAKSGATAADCTCPS
jgi:hypothetical protein